MKFIQDKKDSIFDKFDEDEYNELMERLDDSESGECELLDFLDGSFVKYLKEFNKDIYRKFLLFLSNELDLKGKVSDVIEE
jgi:hypothetical protein